ncbi:hypothetical protein O181_102959 [Austropuccinia psidii MF-1]|uniref:Reverse transcriptase/retrotransposon-derived protein RNase H-like domain-containing protein n=1 Tax=Austropuccinia psidii MF-1 TaxID=1389203 RepID=A0A9Q3JK80_9BASI|nr:hypothetical protein [Austropuccinia psidii MF-1]
MDYQILAAKYKSALKKVRPVNEPMPQDLNPLLERPPLSRDPYETPLSPNPPIFQETFKFTHFIELIRERIRTGLYQQSTSSYTSPIFCVLKSNGKLRIAHELQELNKVTIKDAGRPPHIEEFVDEFAGREFYGLGDIMGGYDERELDVITRPLTTFETPLGRMKLTRLPKGATNSVSVYQAQMTWILQKEIPESVGILIDDGGIKGPTSL